MTSACVSMRINHVCKGARAGVRPVLASAAAKRRHGVVAQCQPTASDTVCSDDDTILSEEARFQEQVAASQAVEERVQFIFSESDLLDEIEKADDNLVVLEIMQDEVCETGMLEPDEGWTPDQYEKEQEKLAKCTAIKHSFTRMAADSPDVTFLGLMADADEESRSLSNKLGVTHYPSVIFFKNSEIVWESWGSSTVEQDAVEGMLYFGQTSNTGLKGGEYMEELDGASAFPEFLSRDDGVPLKCVMICAPFCNPCVHVYPSAVMLAKSFKDSVTFARLSDDESPEMAQLFSDINLLEAPTFIIYKDGVELSRNVSGNRSDLIGFLLDTLFKEGISAPRPN